MAEGKIRDNNHIIEEKSLLFLKALFPIEWVHHKMEPDYGIDIDLELFDYEDGVCVTLGEHVFLQVKGSESLKFSTIEPIGAEIYTKKELSEKQIPVLKYVVDVPLLKLVERMGSTIPVLLIVVDVKEQVAYYICLNDYVRNILPYRANDYKKQDNITIYIPKENILKPSIVSWYGKRAKLYGLFQELLTLADNVHLYNEDHKVQAVEQQLNIIINSHAWSIRKYWPALEALYKQSKELIENNMITETGQQLLNRLVNKSEDSLTKMVSYGIGPMPIPALVAAQAASCNEFLKYAKWLSAEFENHIRHMWLPTQINWMFSH